MKDIHLNTYYKKIQYYVSWFMFIFFGAFLFWFIAIGLASYGKDTEENKNKKKGVLNLTYQKFIYVYGLIITYIFIGIFMLSFIGII